MIEQGTPQWLAQRCGKVTASRIADLTAKTKTGYSASRANYLAQLVAERLTGTVAESYSSPAMQWGTETEPLARAAYEVQTGQLVTECAMIQHPTILMAGASPDGLIGDDGLLEIKCPTTNTHIETLISGEADSRYIKQMMWQMACTGRQWCDFVSFDPRMPADLQLFIKRVPRDKKLIDELEGEVIKFLAEVDDVINKLSDLRIKNGN